MSLATLKADAPPSLSDLARTTLADCSGDVPKAIAAFTNLITNDRRLLKEAAAEIILKFADEAIREKNLSKRGTIVRAARDGRSAVIALAGGIHASLLDFPLPDGRALGDVTAGDVQTMIARYEDYGRDAMHKARWLTLMIQGCPRDKKIREVISADRAQELWDEAAK